MTSQELPFQKKELKIIVHNPNNLPTIDFHQLTELQGDLKISTPKKIQKLKNSIIKYGVFVPKFAWVDNETYYIEDGHQTIKALTELEKADYIVPKGSPACGKNYGVLAKLLPKNGIAVIKV